MNDDIDDWMIPAEADVAGVPADSANLCEARLHFALCGLRPADAVAPLIGAIAAMLAFSSEDAPTLQRRVEITRDAVGAAAAVTERGSNPFGWGVGEQLRGDDLHRGLLRAGAGYHPCAMLGHMVPLVGRAIAAAAPDDHEIRQRLVEAYTEIAGQAERNFGAQAAPHTMC
jgi:hypothetical protein